MNGILLIDKPSGLTSHAVIAKLRKKLGIQKIGHAGTLDPSATGLLVMCIGFATKISSFILESDKIYQTKFQLGKVTTTYDAEGETVSENDVAHIVQQNILDNLVQFRGEILQKPPIYSAIKIKGKKLYQYARSNIEIEIPERKVSIHSLKLLSYDAPFGVLEMSCSKGTYVRSLVHDLGQKLGVGAMVENIRRIQSSPFSIENAVSLGNLLEMELDEIESRLLTVSQVLANTFHTISVSPEDEARLMHGIEYSKRKLENKGYHPDSLFLFVSGQSRKELAIGQWGEKDRISIKRVF